MLSGHQYRSMHTAEQRQHQITASEAKKKASDSEEHKSYQNFEEEKIQPTWQGARNGQNAIVIVMFGGASDLYPRRLPWTR
jgi:hypothetical protein